MPIVKCCRCNSESWNLSYAGLRENGWEIFLGTKSIFLCPICKKSKKIRVKIEDV